MAQGQRPPGDIDTRDETMADEYASVDEVQLLLGQQVVVMTGGVTAPAGSVTAVRG
jgi:hypothetical protein